MCCVCDNRLGRPKPNKSTGSTSSLSLLSCYLPPKSVLGISSPIQCDILLSPRLTRFEKRATQTVHIIYNLINSSETARWKRPRGLSICKTISWSFLIHLLPEQSKSLHQLSISTQTLGPNIPTIPALHEFIVLPTTSAKKSRVWRADVLARRAHSDNVYSISNCIASCWNIQIDYRDAMCWQLAEYLAKSIWPERQILHETRLD